MCERDGGREGAEAEAEAETERARRRIEWEMSTIVISPE